MTVSPITPRPPESEAEGQEASCKLQVVSGKATAQAPHPDLRSADRPASTVCSPASARLQRCRQEMQGLLRGLRPRLLFGAAWARLLPEFALPTLRARFYRLAGCRIAPRVAILGALRLVGPGDVAARLTVAEGTLIATGVTFGLDGEIEIGQNVSIGPQVTFYTATHAIGFGSQRMSRALTIKPIVVESGVWIGMNSLILPGVTLGHGCVVAAGSVVTQSVPPDTLVAGNPAAVQQKLPFGNR